MKRIILSMTSAFALACLPAPAAAQDNEPDAEQLEQVASQFAELFPVEPLTAEQEARLPQATRIVGMMIPEGTLAEMMGSTFDNMLGPILDSVGGASTGKVAEALGVTAFELDLTEEQSAELASLFDPAWEERHAREQEIFPTLMTEMISAMEPGMRKAMSELYAINFNSTELNEIEAFFATETGANFARKSFTMSSDPRILSASMEVLPTIMASIGNLETRMAEAVADLPSARTYQDLSDEERARITELTGLSNEDIEYNLGLSEDAFEEDTFSEEEVEESEELIEE